MVLMGGVARKRRVLSFSGLHSVCTSLLWFELRLMAVAGFWAASLVLLIMDWRSGKISAPRDQPFDPSTVHEQVFEDGDGEMDEESTYEHVPPVTQRNSTYDDPNVAHAPYSDSGAGAGRFRDNDDLGPPASSPNGYPSPPPTRIPASRPSIDAYGAFSDPAPSGFGGGTAAPPAPVSFAPSSPGGAPAVSRTMQYADPYAAVRATIGSPAAGGSSTPPSYESYQGYK
jgi:hypothetical protein